MSQALLGAAFILFSTGCASSSASDALARSAGDSEPDVAVFGALPRTGRLSARDLDALGPVELSWTHEGKTGGFRGVPLEAVLRHFGWNEGVGGHDGPAAERRKGWRCGVLARAADGYAIAFSSAELTADNGPSQVFVVWQEQGRPLPAESGPIRLVVPTDKKGARSVRQLRELRVVDLAQ